MFPTKNDAEEFRLEFGAETIVYRSAKYGATEFALAISPLETKEATLDHAWDLVRKTARWILLRSSELSVTERYFIIVGWSQSVRPSQGQIFKSNGDRDALRVIADSIDWKRCEYAGIQRRWEKDVFDSHIA